MQRPWFSIAAVLIALSCATATTHAALVVYDPFNQSPGIMDGTASSGGTPPALWPTAGQNYGTLTGAAQIVSDSLSGSVFTQGNRAQIGDNNGSDFLFRLFGATLGGPGSDLWISFLISAASAKNSQVISLFNGAQETLAIGVNNAAFYGMSVRTNGATTTAGNPIVSTTLAPDNNAHFVAVHLQLVAGTGNSTFSFFADPSFASYGTAAPTGGFTGVFSGNNSLPFQFDRIRLGEFSGATTAFDEFRIGDTWADVSPTTVPEPSTTLLTALAGLFFTTRRRHPGQ
jgi:hypothetical protein